MNMQQSERSQYNKQLLKVSLLVLLLFSCERSYKIYIEPRNEDAFYQHIKDSLDARSVMAVSAKDKKNFAGICRRFEHDDFSSEREHGKF